MTLVTTIFIVISSEEALKSLNVADTFTVPTGPFLVLLWYLRCSFGSIVAIEISWNTHSVTNKPIICNYLLTKATNKWANSYAHFFFHSRTEHCEDFSCLNSNVKMLLYTHMYPDKAPSIITINVVFVIIINGGTHSKQHNSSKIKMFCVSPATYYFCFSLPFLFKGSFYLFFGE